MATEQLFSIATTTAMAGWLLLVFAPRWASRFVAPVVAPALLGILYTWLIVTRFGGAEGGFGSLADVATLFRDPHLLLAGWVHYLAFDLFVGAWEVRDARRLGIPHLAIIPILFLTFMFGPTGLLLYLVLRAIWKRAYVIGDADAAPVR